MLEWSLKGEAVLGLQIHIPSAQCFLCGPPLLAHSPLPLKTRFPQGTQPKQTPQRKSPSPSSVRGKKEMHVQSKPCGTCEAVGCVGSLLWLRGRAVSMMWWWVKPVRLLSCEVSVIFSQQVPCGVWECLFSGSIMSSAHSLPGAGNLRVEIVPDKQTSFVRKTAVMSVITESDYSGPAALRINTTGLDPKTGEGSSHRWVGQSLEEVWVKGINLQ